MIYSVLKDSVQISSPFQTPQAVVENIGMHPEVIEHLELLLMSPKWCASFLRSYTLQQRSIGSRNSLPKHPPLRTDGAIAGFPGLDQKRFYAHRALAVEHLKSKRSIRTTRICDLDFAKLSLVAYGHITAGWAPTLESGELRGRAGCLSATVAFGFTFAYKLDFSARGCGSQANIEQGREYAKLHDGLAAVLSTEGGIFVWRFSVGTGRVRLTQGVLAEQVSQG